MNKEMKSKLHGLADTCKHPDNYHQGPWMDYIQFAELIIRECDGVTLDYKNEEHYTGWCDHSAEILNHFGISDA